MPQILLTTLNARYIHAAFGLRYLKANLGDLESSCEILEFEISQNVLDVAERLLALTPKIIGIGVYIWNAESSLALVQTLKRVSPQTIIVIGGPEVSYECELQEIVKLADYTICGEADIAFRELCEAVLIKHELPLEKITRARLPAVDSLKLPYYLYNEDDLTNRVAYIEASRGCPFTCEFCLSSIDVPVRQFDTEKILAALEDLHSRGLRTFKFVDRTFNLNIRTANQILQFFLDRMEPGLFVHFEMVPDRFPTQLREVVAKFPKGSLQFEVGIQSFNPEVGKLISRRQDFPKISENISYLRKETGVYIHADLIVGLPGEDLVSFGKGFDTLVALDPHEIQVGILKRLRGTPIIRHDAEWAMRYAAHPPYEVLSTKMVSFAELQQMRRFAKFWDLISNSGNFTRVKYLIWKDQPSPFTAFFEVTKWMHTRFQRRSSIGLKALAGNLFLYLTEELALSAEVVAPIMIEDYMAGGRMDLPIELRVYAEKMETQRRAQNADSLPKLKRQARAV